VSADLTPEAIAEREAATTRDDVAKFERAVEALFMERWGSDDCPEAERRIAEAQKYVDRLRTDLSAKVTRVYAAEKERDAANKELAAYKAFVPWGVAS
jgi:hypothetical protein